MATSETTATVVGESILISGNLSGDEDLTVRGRVEGTVSLSRTLVVEASGQVKAEVQVKSCVISGVVVGNVTATESVEITREGRMVGDISAPRVVIVDGASFRGRIDMGEVDVGERRQPQAAARPAVRPAPPRPPVAARPAPAPAAARAPEPRKLEEKPGPAAVARPVVPPAPVALGAVKRKVLVKTKR